MVPILNTLEVRVGNHDFDFGLHEAEQLAEQCIPWLMSSAWFKATGKVRECGVWRK